MTARDPDEVIAETERRRDAVAEHYLPAVEWFLADPGMGLRDAIVADLANHLGVEEPTANAVVGHLVEDDVDPVQQIVRPTEGKYVGVIDHAEHDWFYAFDRYDDIDGRQRRAVCAHCVHEERAAAEIAHFTRPPDEYAYDAARVALGLHYHVNHEGRHLDEVLADTVDTDLDRMAADHGLGDPGSLSLRDVTRNLDDEGFRERLAAVAAAVPDVDVEPGASLVSGTTIGGNTAWHAGNDGAGSGLNADLVDGKQASDLYRVVQANRTGSARILGTVGTSLFFETLTTDGTTTVTLTATTSWDVGWLEYEVYNITNVTKVQRNGGTTTATPLVSNQDATDTDVDGSVVLTNIDSGEPFTAFATVTSSNSGIVELYLRGGQFV